MVGLKVIKQQAVEAVFMKGENMNFEVGDTVEYVEHSTVAHLDKVYWVRGGVYTIAVINGTRIYLNNTNELYVSASQIKLIKKGVKMNIKQRIEALNNGWDKEADDIINEIYEKLDHGYRMSIPLWTRNSDGIQIFETSFVKSYDGTHGKLLKTFSFQTQCEKNSAFKNALMWLAEEAGMLGAKENDKAEVEIDGCKWEAKLIKKL